MTHEALPSLPPAPDARRLGERFLTGGVSVVLVLALGIAWSAPDWLWVVPVSIVGVVAVGLLQARPLLHLCGVIAGFFIVLESTPGVDPVEVAFTAYYLGYLTTWIGYHSMVRRERLVRSRLDAGIALVLAFGIASLPLTALFEGGDWTLALGQWRSLMILGFYFPLRDACERDPRGLPYILVTLAGLLVAVSVRNMLQYYQALHSAEALWQIMQNRARANERILMIGMLGSLLFWVYYARGFAWRSGLLLMTGMFVAGVILGQSRGTWVAAAVGLAMLVLLLPGPQRVRLLTLVLSATAVITVAVAVLLSDTFWVVLDGLSSRFLSIHRSWRDDLSLVNRFYEWRAALAAFLGSPIIGHGFGVPYSFFNVIDRATETKAFVHNTYIGLLFRHGAVGLLLVAYVAGAALVQGVRQLRVEQDRLRRAVLLTAAVSLPALGVAALTEEMLVTPEGVFSFLLPVTFLAARPGRSVVPSNG